MLGYLNAPVKTEEVLLRRSFGPETEEVWYRTGDLVLTRNGGRDLYHLGRVKDLIWFKKSQFQEQEKDQQQPDPQQDILVPTSGDYDEGGLTPLYPVTIENALSAHPAIRECAVVGVPHPEFVNVPKAFIVLNSGENGSGREEEFVKFVRERVEGCLWLRGGVEVVGALPKNIS